jgi:hypothetical protein
MGTSSIGEIMNTGLGLPVHILKKKQDITHKSLHCGESLDMGTGTNPWAFRGRLTDE